MMLEDTLVAVALYTDGRSNMGNAKDFAMMVTANTGPGGHAQQGACGSLTRIDDMEGDQTDQKLVCP